MFFTWNLTELDINVSDVQQMDSFLSKSDESIKGGISGLNTPNKKSLFENRNSISTIDNRKNDILKLSLKDVKSKISDSPISQNFLSEIRNDAEIANSTTINVDSNSTMRIETEDIEMNES